MILGSEMRLRQQAKLEKMHRTRVSGEEPL